MRPLHILAFLLLFKSLRGIEVGFGEDDISCSEDDLIINVLIAANGYMEAGHSVTLEVVPVTLEEYVAMNHSLPDGINLNEDPAESGLDFNNQSRFVTFSDSIDEVTLQIGIVQDRISENEEVFLIILREVSKPAEEGGSVPVIFGRAITVAHIEQPRTSKVTFGFSEKQIVASEDSGTISDELFIEISGQIEPTVSVKITSDSGKDVTVPSRMTITSSDGLRIPVPLHIVDDLIAEQEECMHLTLQQDFHYKSLYSIDMANSRVEICISDNDIPRLGFEIEPSGNVTGHVMDITEGETKRVCIVLVEPEDCEVYMRLNVSLSEDSPKGLILFQPRPIYFYKGKRCFEVSANDNLDINYPPQVKLELSTEVFNGANLISGEGYVLTDSGLLSIKDNDGVPALPGQVFLEFDGESLHISWQSQASDLQPVDKFIVVVQTTPTHDIIRSRRQAETIQVPLLAPEDSWEYETKETSLKVKFTESNDSDPYTVSVCAVNDFGRECTVPQEVLFEIRTLPKPEGLVVEEKKPSRGLIIAIAVVVPVMVVVLCMAVLCVVVICRSYGRSKEYRPARQGIIQEKIVMGSIDPIQPKYCKRSSSASSACMEWTSIEPDNTVPVTPPKNERPETRILGTPV